MGADEGPLQAARKKLQAGLRKGVADARCAPGLAPGPPPPPWTNPPRWRATVGEHRPARPQGDVRERVAHLRRARVSPWRSRPNPAAPSPLRRRCGSGPHSPRRAARLTFGGPAERTGRAARKAEASLRAEGVQPKDWGIGAVVQVPRVPVSHGGGGGGGLEWLTSAHVGQDNVITVADRRVDLSGEGASLYSQCRRWVQNAPEEALEPPDANPAGAEPAEAKRGPEHEGPASETGGPEVVEPPDWSQLLDPDRQPAVEELKKHHLVHWVKVRKSRLKHRQKKLERFNRKLARLLTSDKALPPSASESEKPEG